MLFAGFETGMPIVGLLLALPPGVVSSFASKFFYGNDIEVVPVVDIAEAVTIGAASLSCARAVVSG